MPAAAEKGRPDWDRIERDYRAGILSLREIAGKDGNVTEGAIRKRAKRDSWDRDLSAAIRAKAEALVRKDAVRTEVRADAQITERETIEAGAAAIAQVRLAHRQDIRRSRDIVVRLLSELETQILGQDDFEQLGELMRRENEAGTDKLNDLYHKIIGFGGRVTSIKSLSDALKNLIGLEREAWSLGEPEKKTDDPSDLSDTDLDQRIAASYARLATGKG
jgi:hypothetical protein